MKLTQRIKRYLKNLFKLIYRKIMDRFIFEYNKVNKQLLVQILSRHNDLKEIIQNLIKELIPEINIDKIEHPIIREIF